MINYINSFDESKRYELNEELIAFGSKLRKIMGCDERIPAYWGLDNPVRGFLIIMNSLERLFFDNFEQENNFVNRYFDRNYDYFKASLLLTNNDTKTGFCIAVSPKTRWQPIENAVHLEAAEKTLKEYPSQFLKIFTVNNKLGIYMNKQPTWDQIVKFKTLQWGLFTDKIDKTDSLIPELLAVFRKKNVEKSNEILNKILSKPELAELKMKEIKKIFTYGATTKTREIESNIKHINERLIQLENKYNQMVRDLNTYNIQLEALQTNPNIEVEPLIKYLAKHPYIKDVQAIDASRISLYYEAPIVYFDKFILDTIKRNRSDVARRILDIFAKDEYQLMTRCKIVFDTEYFEVTMNTIGAENLIGHPHIDRFKCFGNHGMAIKESAKAVDYLGAIEQISQAVLNLNFSDTYVINEMLNTLSRYPEKFKTWRHKETNTMLTTKEVLDQYEETKIENE